MMHDLSLLIIVLLVIAILAALAIIYYFTYFNPDDEARARKLVEYYHNLIETANKILPSTTNIDIPVYYINLDSSSERRLAMEEQITRYQITATRISGVKGATDPSISYYNDFSDMKPGEVGCTLSHLRAIKTARDNGLEYVLIIEDDTSFLLSPHWNRKLSEYIARAPADWSLLKLFSDLNYREMRSEYHRTPEPTNSTTAYIINRRGMDQLLERTYVDGTFILSRHIFAGGGQADLYLYRLHPEEVIYLINPPLVFPDNRFLSSTIHDDHTLTHLRLAAETIKPYIDHIYRSYLGQLSDEWINLLTPARRDRRSQEQPTRVDIVIAYYNYPLSWLERALRRVDRSLFRVFIYRKGQEEIPLDRSLIHEVIDLPNLGRCDHSYVYHIMEHYRRPVSQYTIFLKDSSFRHLGIGKLAELIEQYNQETCWGSLLNNYEIAKLSGFELNDWCRPHDQNQGDPFVIAPPSLRPFSQWYSQVLNKPFQAGEIKQAVYGGTFIAPSDRFQRTSYEAWRRILFSLSYGSNVETGHYMERLWYHLLQ